MDKKKFFIIGFILILLVGVPLTIYFLQKQQEIRSRAVASTTLELTPATATGEVGKPVSLDVTMNPGTNQVIATTLIITYDPSKFATTSSSLTIDAKAFPSVLEGPVFGPGTISITATVGVDVTKAIQTQTKIATVTLNAIAETTEPTQVGFAKETNVTSTSDPEVNVLSSTKPASVTIGPATNPPPPPGGNPPPPPPPAAATATPKPTKAPTGGGGGTTGPNKAPECTALNVDRSPTGNAPFSVTFTAVGDDSDGTIQKVSFNFGDGPVQNVVSNNGIGTNSVSVPIAHNYTNPGTYTATVVLTDNNNAVSAASASCTQTVTVSGAPTPTPPAGLGGGGPLGPASPTPKPSLAPTGPGDTIIGIGAVSVIMSVLGAAIFLSL